MTEVLNRSNASERPRSLNMFDRDPILWEDMPKIVDQILALQDGMQYLVVLFPNNDGIPSTVESNDNFPECYWNCDPQRARGPLRATLESLDAQYLRNKKSSTPRESQSDGE